MSLNLKNAPEIESQPERFILTELDKLILLFPSSLVAKIIIVETAHILSLPLYSDNVVGCIHHEGEVIPLIFLSKLFAKKTSLGTEKIKVVRLGQEAGNLQGIGIIVSKVLGSKPKNQIPLDVLNKPFPVLIDGQKMCRFLPELLDNKNWQPRQSKLLTKLSCIQTGY